MIQKFSVQIPLRNVIDRFGRRLTERKLRRAKASGKLFSVGGLRLRIRDVVKTDRHLYFLVEFDPATGVIL